ncbi:MAG: flagellar motor switch protein FliN [Tepidisphaeraceae bacterium]|jgi:flagellar motor switch protein FliN
MAEQPPPGESPAQQPQQPSEPAAPPAPAEAAVPPPAEASAPLPAEASVQPAPADAPAQAAAQDAAVSEEAIDALLKQANFDSPDGTEAAEGKALSVEQLLKQANSDDAATGASEVPGGDAEAFKLPSFQQVMADAQVSSIDLLRDVELNVKIELGRSRMLVDEVLKLSEGSVVELDKLAGDPVDVFVNDRLVARGEVLVLNDNFCVRVNEIVPGAKEEAM